VLRSENPERQVRKASHCGSKQQEFTQFGSQAIDRVSLSNPQPRDAEASKYLGVRGILARTSSKKIWASFLRIFSHEDHFLN